MDFDMETSVLLIKILFYQYHLITIPHKVSNATFTFAYFPASLSHGWGCIKQANTLGNFDYLTKGNVSLSFSFLVNRK